MPNLLLLLLFQCDDKFIKVNDKEPHVRIACRVCGYDKRANTRQLVPRHKRTSMSMTVDASSMVIASSHSDHSATLDVDANIQPNHDLSIISQPQLTVDESS